VDALEFVELEIDLERAGITLRMFLEALSGSVDFRKDIALVAAGHLKSDQACARSRRDHPHMLLIGTDLEIEQEVRLRSLQSLFPLFS
jgi:hypothetical protein